MCCLSGMRQTGYRTSGEKRWLRALVAANFVFYKIALTRGAEVLVELPGEVSWAYRKSARRPTPNVSAATLWRCMRACSGYGIVFATDPVSDMVPSHASN
jgi:hypothetical protein